MNSVKKKSINLKLNIEIPKIDTMKNEREMLSESSTPMHHAIKSENTAKKSGLDEFQQNAVKSGSNQLLIIAGPGSGKTTVLTRRIAYLINEKNIKPENCLAITFTRRAAEEMRERLNKLLPCGADKLNIHTFHSLCFSILKENYETAGLDKEFNVMSEQEKALCKDEKLLENALSFDDLITLTVKLLQENDDLLKNYRERFKYVSVDEYQDIDENQYKLIRLLVPQNGNIFVIGDPNQAIYGFRGGNAKFFNNFKDDYPDTQIINLKNNYRSTNSIVDASNQMINCFNIVSVFDKPHEKITIHKAPTDKAEAEFIASSIENLIGGHSFFSIDSQRSHGEDTDYSFSDFAILYRTSSQLPPIIEALKRTGMPFVKLSNDLLCEQKSVMQLLNSLDGNSPIDEQIKNSDAEIDDYILKYLLNIAQNSKDKNEFIHQVSLLTEADTLDKRADRITLMTLHASKGLEFKCVFIAGLENGILPLYRAKEEKEIEEERRLLYVGMTRAKERLFLSHSEKRFWLGTLKNLPISPFLTKVQDDLLKLSSFKKVYKEKDNTEQLSLF